jgi:hypothetical protein
MTERIRRRTKACMHGRTSLTVYQKDTCPTTQLSMLLLVYYSRLDGRVRMNLFVVKHKKVETAEMLTLTFTFNTIVRKILFPSHRDARDARHAAACMQRENIR